MKIGIPQVITIYEFFYQKKYNTLKYKFKPSSSAIVKIQSFLEFLDKKYVLETLGIKFLSTYFMFQFNRTHKQVFNRFASRDVRGKVSVGGRIQIYDVVGKQALKYWLERDIRFDYVLSNCDFAKEHRVSYSECTSLLFQPVRQQPSLLYSEEIEKNKFLNQKRGLLHCIEKTSLFNHRSINCLSCKERGSCKSLLKANYNHIYIERGYGETTLSHK